MTSPLEIRSAVPSDVDAIARVESAGWRTLAPTRDDVESRVRTYPEGQLVALRDGTIVGGIATQRLTSEFFQRPPVTYDRLTDGGRLATSHDPRGEVFQLIGVAVDPSERGAGLGRLLVNRAIALARSLEGIQRILGYTRPVGFHRFPALTIERYLELSDSAGRPVDPVVSMHTENGATIVAIQPDFRPADTETCGHGVLIEYPRVGQ